VSDASITSILPIYGKVQGLLAKHAISQSIASQDPLRKGNYYPLRKGIISEKNKTLKSR
jgi:hypothetical protein